MGEENFTKFELGDRFRLIVHQSIVLKRHVTVYNQSWAIYRRGVNIREFGDMDLAIKHYKMHFFVKKLPVFTDTRIPKNGNVFT